MQNNRWLQALIVLLVLIASAWLVAQLWAFMLQFSNVLLLFFVSWLLAFILRPVARGLAARGVPYGVGVAVVYLVLFLIITLGAIYAVPEITKQVTNFATAVEDGSLIRDGENILRSWGLRDDDIEQLYTNIVSRVQEGAVQALQGAAGILGQVATFFFQLILVFLLSFYFMKDGEKIANNVVMMLPPRWQDEVRLAALSIEKSFGGFVRGQIVFAVVYGVLTAIIMMIPPFQLQFVLVASIIAGLFMLIPLVGNLLAFGPPLLALFLTPVAAGEQPKGELWLWFFLALFIMQSIMTNVLGPRIMSSAIGIHPIYVWAAILIGGQVAGIWGVLFGIPIAGAINLIGRPLMRRIRHQTNLYKESRVPAPSTASFLTGPLAASMAESRAHFEEAAQRAQSDLREPEMEPHQPPIQARPTRPQTQIGGLQGHGAQQARSPVEATAPMPVQVAAVAEEDEDDVVLRPAPTLTARAWRMLFVMLSRLRGWAKARGEARAARR